MHKRLVTVLSLFFLALSTIATASPSPRPLAGFASGGQNSTLLDTTGAAPLRQIEIGKTDRFVVEFAADADLRPAREIADFAARGRFVVERLRATADSSQREALALIRATPGARAHAFWLHNAIVVDGDADLAERLAALPGVASVRPERIYPIAKPLTGDQAIRAATGDPEWGVAKIGADEVWAQGITGSGIVVANIDTGVDYSHPALVNQYRGNLGAAGFDHNYNWWDPTNICGRTPCDNAGHGTHTMGSIVGGDGPGPFTPDIGVAPGATWIAAKGCEDFGCSEFALLSAGQFVLAPTDLNGQNPNPALRPDIVNNSWGGEPGGSFYADVVTAWRAAGIIPVFSSGNPGSFCGAGGSPGDFLNSFSVGATDSDDIIADFSGRGPSVFGKINPDVTAPGVDVLSAIPSGDYLVASGTSMAAPHTSGTLALVLSAASGFVGDPEGATDVVRRTALDIIDMSCGGDLDGDPNNTYGDGRIDAALAVNLVATGGTLEGTITDASTGNPVAAASVSADNGIRVFPATTDAAGGYRLFLPAGEYVVTATAFGYGTSLVPGVTVATDETSTADLAIEALPSFALTGFVREAESRKPIAGAKVTAIGTPLEPVLTDATGAYSFTLPIGSYDLRASAGGCMEQGFGSLTVRAAARLNFFLVTKIDESGHGCVKIPNEWHEAKHQTALFGDDNYGRLLLPFEFPFYGDDYDRIYVATNGFISLVDPFHSSPFPEPIPSRNIPNAGIYALWSDLVVDEEAQVTYDVVGTAPNQAFVVEYENPRHRFGEDRLDFEVKLWQNGDIDVLYRNNANRAGDGSTAAIGIENAAGTDGLQFSLFESSLDVNAAYRFKVVPTGFAGGTVIDANDGLPVVGALITAQPGGRTAVTDGDGRYSLRLVPGRYVLTIDALNYGSSTSQPVFIRAGATSTVDFMLVSPVAVVTPTEIAASTELGENVAVTLTISNAGTAAYEWQLLERDGGTAAETLDELPPLDVPQGTKITRDATWSKPNIPEGFVSHASGVTFMGGLETIITDPEGDQLGRVDVIAVRGGATEEELSIAIDFAPGTDPGGTSGFVYLDTDQNPATGLPASALNGLPTQDVGMEYFVDLSAVTDLGIGFVIDARTFSFVGEFPVEVTATSLRFDVPLAMLGGDDGAVDVALVSGDLVQWTDWAPDVGHGTVLPFRDTPWMEADPASGVLEPGAATDVVVTLGGMDVLPGAYLGELALVGNDARRPVISIPVDLVVELPADFGQVAGTFTNSRVGFPVPATISVSAERAGAPWVVTATASDVDGTYVMFVPEGTWPATIEFGGYVTTALELSVAAGESITLDVALDPLWPNATVSGGPFDFAVVAGAAASLPMEIANLGGIVDLEFEILEVGGVLPEAGAAERRVEQLPAGVSASQPPDGWAAAAPARAVNGHPVLVFQDALPWGSTALQDLLASNGIPYDVAGSADMGLIDLSPYGVVFISNDQPQEFYDRYGVNRAWFESYVTGGGYLWFGAAAWGWNAGDFSGGVLPGGVTVSLVHENFNEVVDAGHPIMFGVPNPFSGSAASPAAFADAPEGSVIAAGTDSGQPTLLEYPLGLGRVLAFGQPLEFAYDFGQDAAIILQNAIPYVHDFIPFEDVPWLSVDPSSGSVEPDGTLEMAVHVDSTGLDPGHYEANLVVRSNDPLNPVVLVPVTLTVS